MSTWITALRIAGRETRRAKGRSILVLALITLPVMLLTFAAVNYDMFDLTAEEKLDRELGSADARVVWETDAPLRQPWDGNSWLSTAPDLIDPERLTDAELLALLPAGSQVTPIREFVIAMQTPNGHGDVKALQADVASTVVEGRIDLVEGTAPVTDDQVTLNEQAARWLDVAVGDTVRTVQSDRAFTVTGIVALAELKPRLVFRPGAVAGPQGNTWLISVPVTLDWPQVKQLNEQGLRVRSRAVVLDPPADDGWDHGWESGPDMSRELTFGGLIAGLAMLEIVLLAGPAFAVGARRRARDLALVAANGGSPRHLRRIVLADGIVLGIVAAVIGVTVGVLAAVLGRPLVEEYVAGWRAGGWRFFPTALAAIAFFALVTSLLAAVAPAFTAARQDVVTVLAGRRGAVRSRKRWITAGLILVAAGVAVGMLGAAQPDPNVIMIGVVIGEIGLVLVTPALIGLIARLGRWLPLAPRIALRDTARNRSSAAPAISAIMAAVAGAVAIGVFIGGNHQHNIDIYRYDLPEGYVGVSLSRQWDADEDEEADNAAVALAIENVLHDILPVAEVRRYETWSCDWADLSKVCQIEPVLPAEQRCPSDDYSDPKIRLDPRCHDVGYGFAGNVIDDGSSLAAFTDASPEQVAAARQVLAAGGVVVSNSRFIVDGKITLARVRGIDHGKQGDAKTVPQDTPPAPPLPDITVPGYALEGRTGFHMMMSPSLLTATDLRATTGGFVAATTRMPTAVEQERLTAALSRIDSAEKPYAHIERGPSREQDVSILILAAAAALIALGAAGVATGLAMADGRGDLGTLAAVGASPRVRRGLSLSHSGTISILGATLGTVAGLGAAAAIIEALNRGSPGFQQVPMPFLVPWPTLAIVVAVPVIAMLGAGLLTRSRLPIERRF